MNNVDLYRFETIGQKRSGLGYALTTKPTRSISIAVNNQQASLEAARSTQSKLSAASSVLVALQRNISSAAWGGKQTKISYHRMIGANAVIGRAYARGYDLD